MVERVREIGRESERDWETEGEILVERVRESGGVGERE